MPLSPPAPRDIQQAVVAWHNRHPLAARIDASQVHSIGWVALPFLRPPQGVEPTLDAPPQAPKGDGEASPQRSGLRRWMPGVKSAQSGPWPVFSETFIDGLSARRAAAFTVQHGSAEAPAPDTNDWPQRRIDVDGDLAERSAGGWPVELWVISAAIDVGKERRRVLVGADGQAVAGPRHWRRHAWPALGLGSSALLVAGAVAWWGLGKHAQEPTSPAATSPAQGASAPAAGPIEASAPAAPASAASPPQAVASEPSPAASAASASGTERAASAPEVPASAPSADEPAPDIRPQLVKPLPNRRGTTAAPMLSKLGGASAEAPQPAPPAASGPNPAPAPANTSSPPRADGPYRGAATPEQLRPGLSAQGPLIALVSPGTRSKAEAEAMLGRMTEHLKATMAQQSGLRGEVIETPEGWRAAVYPFATREEAAILNATMVARGWRTRSVTF